jgi:hypothetical protein
MTPPETRFGGLTIWSPAPDQVAGILSGALNIRLQRRTATAEGGHYSGRAGDLTISVHPGDEPAIELAFLVPAIGTAIDECRARGAAVTSAPGPRPYGTSATLLGPGSLRLELVQTPPSAGQER